MKSLKTAYLKIISLIFFISFMLFGPNLSQLKTTTNSDEIVGLIGFIICSGITLYLILRILMKLPNLSIDIMLSSIVIIGSLFNLYSYQLTNENLNLNIFIFFCIYAEFIISIAVFFSAIIYKIYPSYKEDR